MPAAAQRFRVYNETQLEQIPQVQALDADQIFSMRVVASVLPFRVNEYVVDNLIDWSRVPNDPVFQLTFPQPEMLRPKHYARISKLLRANATKAEVKEEASSIRAELNPHPAGQQEHNVPIFEGKPLAGVQHKYRETVLFFPAQGQTCHSYCTFCFRWAQFVGDKDLKFASTDSETLHRYLASDKKITDLLVTGGDPMVMKTHILERYLAPLLDQKLAHVQNIRIGSKALTFWPQRFVTDSDAGALLDLFKRLVEAGKHIAYMAHFEHGHEMDTDICRQAIRNLREAGVVIRSQAPLLRHINDSTEAWAEMWKTQVGLGIIPYYMFIERDTGARNHFEVPLVRAWEIYRKAISQVSGLSRTVRGPSMSAGPGKIEIQGVAEVAGEKVFVLRFIQGRNPDWAQRPFFAAFDPQATWYGDLRPAFGEEKFFFEDEYAELCADKASALTEASAS